MLLDLELTPKTSAPDGWASTTDGRRTQARVEQRVGLFLLILRERQLGGELNARLRV